MTAYGGPYRAEGGRRQALLAPALVLTAVSTIVLLLAAQDYAADLAVRVVQRRFTVQAEGSGRQVRVVWGIPDTRGRPRVPKENRVAFPQEKVLARLWFADGRTRIVTVAGRTPNDGLETLSLPRSIPRGARISIILQAVNGRGHVLPIVATETAPTVWVSE